MARLFGPTYAAATTLADTARVPVKRAEVAELETVSLGILSTYMFAALRTLGLITADEVDDLVVPLAGTVADQAVQLGQNSASITFIQNTYATNTDVEAKKTEAITAAAASANASIATSLSTYATQDFAEAKKTEAIAAAAASANASLATSLSAYATLALAEAKKTEAITAAAASANASIATSLSTYATQDFAEAKKTEAITAAAGNTTAAVLVETTARVTAIGGIHTRWGVQLDGEGRVVGRIRMDGTGATSSLDFTFETLRVSHPAAPEVFFRTMNRSSGAKSNHTFGTGLAFALTHTTPAELFGPSHASAAGSPDQIVAIRDGGCQITCIARIVGYTGPATIYYRKAGGAFVAFAALESVSGIPLVASRGPDYFTGLVPGDKLEFYIAPCDGNGDLAVAVADDGTLRTEIDALAFNW
jgi:hypothetical protein